MIFGAGALAQRRAEALERCASLRVSIAEAAAPILAKAGTADRVLGAVRQHPIAALLAAGIAGRLLPALLTRSLPRWIARALVLYSLLGKK